MNIDGEITNLYITSRAVDGGLRQTELRRKTKERQIEKEASRKWIREATTKQQDLEERQKMDYLGRNEIEERNNEQCEDRTFDRGMRERSEEEI